MKKVMTDEVKKHVKRMLNELETDCVKGAESYYLRYEFLNMMYYLDNKEYRSEYGFDEKKFFKLLDKLQDIVCRKYKCVRVSAPR